MLPPLAYKPLTQDWAGDLGRMFKALGDPVRLRLLTMVASHRGGDACVCDLTPAFDLSQPTISHHLKALREAGLLECERRGTWVVYWLVPAALAQLAAISTRSSSPPSPSPPLTRSPRMTVPTTVDGQEDAVVGKLSTLDRFLPVWIGVAMVVGLLLAAGCQVSGTSWRPCRSTGSACPSPSDGIDTTGAV